jgi:hypothetical protein
MKPKITPVAADGVMSPEVVAVLTVNRVIDRVVPSCVPRPLYSRATKPKRPETPGRNRTVFVPEPVIVAENAAWSATALTPLLPSVASQSVVNGSPFVLTSTVLVIAKLPPDFTSTWSVFPAVTVNSAVANVDALAESA